jgi:DNA-binding MarR family transcriptional regulator
VSNFINQSRYIVIVAGKPEFNCEFRHAKAAEAEAYKATPSAISAAGDITPSTFTRQIKTWEERRLALIRKARGQAA